MRDELDNLLFLPPPTENALAFEQALRELDARRAAASVANAVAPDPATPPGSEWDVIEDRPLEEGDGEGGIGGEHGV